MNKKKVVSLVIAGMLAVGAVGGTFAWFTSNDSLTNSFSTGNVDHEDPNHGLHVDENFDPHEAEKVTPGTEINKDVRVQSLASYDQFIRVKLTPKFTGSRPEVGIENLDAKLINLKLANTDSADDGYWMDGGDGYYYYIGKVSEKNYTKYLLDSVTLDTSAGNEYQGANFDVVVDATGVQASHDAYKDEFASASQAVQDALAAVQ